MNILTEKDITPETAKFLRSRLRMSQAKFWPPVGAPQSSGSNYESGREIPHAVRILVFCIYVAGLKIDASTPEGTARLFRLARQEIIDSTKVVAKKTKTTVEGAV